MQPDSIRILGAYCELPTALLSASLEVPEHEGHYRNQPAYHAPTLLRKYYDDLRSLIFVPNHCTESVEAVYEVGQTSRSRCKAKLVSGISGRHHC